MAELLEGKPIAAKIKEGLKAEVEKLKSTYGLGPRLVAVQVGENPASAVYVKSQRKVSEALGIEYELKQLDAKVSEREMIGSTEELNKDELVSGIMIQLPLPEGLNFKKIVGSIDPKKDAEGMHPANLGKVLLGRPQLAPCTPLAVMELVKEAKVDLYGKEVVCVGHSEIVGKPLALLFLDKFATTTVCHIGTGERGLLPDHVKRAEVLVVAVGKAGLIKGEWIKDGAIVIDVGINRVGDKIVGDVEFDEAAKRASFITPVPGGVGPLTTAMLMRNVVEAFKLQRESGTAG